MSEPLFYIWSIEHTAWWPASRCGYVDDLIDAGHFTRTEANQILAQANLVKTNECAIPVVCADQFDASQLMALCDIVAHYILYPTSSDTFVDVANNVETHIDELLGHLLKLRGMR